MLLNNLDREVAEHPEELVVYGGSGKAARSPAALRALVRSLLELGEDETLLVQSGKPVGIFRTHRDAPRVLIANSLLVPQWATWEEFRRLEALGLTMFGQMTAGSWIYIGTQGILQGTYQTFAAAGEKHFGSADLVRQDDPHRRARRHGRRAAARRDDGGRGDPLRRGRSDADRAPARDALPGRGDRLARRRARAGARRGVGGTRAVGRSARKRGRGRPRAGPPRRAVRLRHRPDRGPRSAERLHPRGATRSRRPRRCAGPIRTGTCNERSASIATHVHGMLEYARAGANVFDYGNNLRGEARDRPASRRRSHTRASSPPTSGRSSAAASGPSAGRRSRVSRATSRPSTRCSCELFPDDPLLQRWLEIAGDRVAFQGLPARICWLGYGARAKAGLAINELVRSGEVSRADRDRARPPRRGLGRLARTARRRRCRTAPTRSPTGRS